uniref:Large polyvalent protein associated domain-containing protein n=1 Tax=viral metagenome TaxID=1070528 RepID=A0A6H1ZD00_9ZZZZ
MAEKFSAQWYEEKARKHKLKTWTPSERFPEMGKGGRLDLQMSTDLAEMKPFIKEIENNPELEYALSSKAKSQLAQLKLYAPSLFVEVEPLVKPKTTTETALQSAQETEQQAKLYDVGGATPMETYLKTGYFPETSFIGKWQAGQKTLGNRLLSMMWAAPRAKSAIANVLIAKAKSEITPEMRQGSTFDKMWAATKLTAKQLPTYGKEAFRTGVPAFFGVGEEKYRDWTWAKTLKEQLGEEAPWVIKNWEWTKDQDDWVYGTNWIQKAGSAIAGSPADLAGLVLDILTDELTYITGGIGKSAKVGTIAKSITAKGGKVILKKGSTLALTKAGSRLVAESLPDAIPIIKKIFAKEIATFIGEGAQQSAKRFIVKKAGEYIITNTAKKLPAAQAAKLIEYGGLKYMGQTIIPGEKFAQTFGKAFTGENLPKILKTLNKFLNPFAQVPDEIRPILSAQQSMARSRFNKFLFDTGDVVRPLSKTEKNTLADVMAIERDLMKSKNVIAGIGKLDIEEILPKAIVKSADDLYRELDDIGKSIAKIRDQIVKESDVIVPKGLTGEFIDKLKAIENYITDSGGIRYTAEMADEYKRLPFYLKAKKGYLNASSLDEMAADIANAYPEYGIKYGRDLITTMKDLRTKAKVGITETYQFTDREIKEIIDDMFLADFRAQANVPGFAGKFQKDSIADLIIRQDEITRKLVTPGFGEVGIKPVTLFPEINLDSIMYKEQVKIDKLNELMSKLDITPKVSAAHDKIHNMLDTEYAFIQSKIGDKVKYMEQYYPARYEKAPLPFLTKTAELGKEVAPFELKQQMTYLQALEAGLKPKSVFETLSQYGFESAQRTARADFLNEVKQFGMMTDEVTKGYVKARDVADKIIPELKGWQFPDEIAKTFKRTYTTFFGDDATKAIINVYDRALTVWKRIALATPGYHLRNFYSDTYSGLMEYGLEFLNPRHWNDAIKIWTGKTVVRNGQKYTREIFMEYGVRAGQYMQEAALTGAAPARMIGKISPLEWSARFGAGRENLGRTVGALISLEHGNNIIDAAWTVKKVFFDYASLTAAEKNIMARIFPFYRWMRKNLERQFELILTRTGKYATIPKMMNYVENVAATRYGQDYMDEYGKFKPEYYERLGAMVTGATNVQGQPLVFNPNLPFQDLLSFGIKDLINKVTPLLKMGIEIPGKREIFTGAYLDFDKMKPAPQWLEVLVGKLPESLLVQMGMEKKNGELQMSGATEYVLKQVPTLYNLSRAMPAEETAKTPLDLLSMLGGIKFFNLDLEKQKEYKYKQFTTSMSKLLKRKVPEEELIPPKDMERVYRQIYSDYVIANIMQTKNYDINEIVEFKDMTKYSGSTKEIDLFIDLMQKPYKDEMAKIKGKTLPELAQILSDLGIIPTAEEVNIVLQQLKAQQ